MSKPIIPEDTCPYIDLVQTILDNLVKQEDPEWRGEQAELAKTLLEHVRTSNAKLRSASKYWHDQNHKRERLGTRRP
jgi:hypothetical protein